MTWGNCVATDTVRELGVALSSDAGVKGRELLSLRVSAIARDGIESVRFDMADGDDVSVDVVDNLFSVALLSEPTGMSWQDSEGDTHRPSQFPDMVGHGMFGRPNP